MLAAGCHEKSLRVAIRRRWKRSPPPAWSKPELRDLTCTVPQPGFIDAYEQTAIYSKVSGFIKKLDVDIDIGHQVKKGDLLCEIFVPELEEEHQLKLAQVELDKRGVEQAEKLVKVAESNIQTTMAQLAEARSRRGKVPGRGRPLGIRGETSHPNGAGQGDGQASSRRVAGPARLQQVRPRCRPSGRRREAIGLPVGHGRSGQGQGGRGVRQGQGQGLRGR